MWASGRSAIRYPSPAAHHPLPRCYKRNTMKITLLLAAVGGILAAQSQPVLGEDTVKVSEHVWAIMGFPNIAIIVGKRATLVVDTGLGPANGATIARVVAKMLRATGNCFSPLRTFIPSTRPASPVSPREPF